MSIHHGPPLITFYADGMLFGIWVMVDNSRYLGDVQPDGVWIFQISYLYANGYGSPNPDRYKYPPRKTPALAIADGVRFILEEIIGDNAKLVSKFYERDLVAQAEDQGT